MSMRGYYNKEFCYMISFDDDFMKMDRQVNF